MPLTGRPLSGSGKRGTCSRARTGPAILDCKTLPPILEEYPLGQREELSLRDRMSKSKSLQNYDSFRQTRDNMHSKP